MGCGCKKPKNVEAVIVPTPTPQPIRTPDELHTQQLNDFYNNLDDYHIEKKDDNG
jgi:hypothetical protein